MGYVLLSLPLSDAIASMISDAFRGRIMSCWCNSAPSVNYAPPMNTGVCVATCHAAYFIKQILPVTALVKARD